MYKGAPPIEATESTRNKQLYLQEQIITQCSCYRCDVDKDMSAASYLWHSCPMPSKGCKTPVEDSPCARKSSTGLCLDKACEEITSDQTDCI